MVGGDTIEINTSVRCYSSSDRVEIWYFNTTGWRKLFSDSNCNYPSSSGVYTTDATVDDVAGTHYVRAINAYGWGGGSSCYTGSWGDNDDLGFSVIVTTTTTTTSTTSSSTTSTLIVTTIPSTTSTTTTSTTTSTIFGATTTTLVILPLRVHFIDVGQGDSILIETPSNKTMMIDFGENADTIKNYLETQGIYHVDVAVATHPHADHIGGFVDTFNNTNFTLGMIYDNNQSYSSQTYQRYHNFAQSLDYSTMSRGFNISLDANLEIMVVTPPQPFISSNANDNSVVVKLKYNDLSFLFTGDCGAACEDDILNSSQNISSCVLKVGHHGSSTSSTQSFLDAVSPTVSVISVGTGNQYGHPSQATLDKLGGMSVTVYRTDLDGDIVVETVNGSSCSDISVTTTETTTSTTSTTTTTTSSTSTSTSTTTSTTSTTSSTTTSTTTSTLIVTTIPSTTSTTTTTSTTLIKPYPVYNGIFNATANESIKINASKANVYIGVVLVENITNGQITVTMYNNTENTSLSVPGLNRFVNIEVSQEILDHLSSALLKMFYTDQELTDSGLSETELALYWYNVPLSMWQELNPSNMDWVYGSGVNTSDNYVWANVTHFSDYTIAQSNPLSTSTSELITGWNLISLPLSIL